MTTSLIPLILGEVMEPAFWTVFGWGFALVAGGGLALIIPLIFLFVITCLFLHLLKKL